MKGERSFKQNHKLPVEVEPPLNINESCFGFTMRMAGANGYPSPYWISDLEPCLRYPQLHDKNVIEKAIIRLTGLSSYELTFLDYSLLMNRHVKEVHYSTKLRMCPECVKSGKYLDYMWEITFASACPHHGIKLIDYCPKCLCSLSWNRVQLELCSCGTNLTHIDASAADERLLYYNTKIWSAMGRKVPVITLPDVPDEIFSLFGPNGVCDLFRFLYRVGNPKAVNSSFKLKNVSEAVQAFEIIHLFLSEWPLGLYRYFDTLRNVDGSFKGEGLQKAFGKFYLGLYGKNEFKFIEEAFEAYIRSHWPGVIDRKYKRLSSGLECNYSLIGNAVKKTHFGRVRINKLMDMGVVAGIRNLRPSGRYYAVLKKCEVNRIAKLSRHMINKKETCRMMGISKSEFEVLVEYKVIKPLVKAGDRGFSEWWCDSRKIRDYLEKILAMVPKQKSDDDAISFSKMCQAHLTNINLLPELLQSIITGQANVAGMDLDASDGEFRLSSLYFAPDEIASFRKRIKMMNASAYSIPDVANMMGLKQQVAYHLVNSGFLKCHEDPAGFLRGRLVSFEDIVAFEKRYIPLTEIARSRNQCPRTLMTMLKRLGVSPVIGGGIDGCRQVFYCRAKIRSLKI